MYYLFLGLPVHRTQVLYLDEDARADLVNRYGGKLRLLLLLLLQSSDVLGGCKKGGHIRWHHLATEEDVLSSDFRDGCLNTRLVSVGIKEPDAGTVAMSETDLRKFTYDFGVDLNEIRKLGKEEMECLFGWLRDAGMVECFDVLQNQAPANVNSPEPLGDYSLSPSCYANAGDEFDRFLEQFDTFLEQYDPSAERPHTVSSRQEPVTPHGLVRYQSVHSPPSTDSSFTPSSYPTPSTSYINSPPGGEPLAPLESSVSNMTKLQLLHSCRFGKDGNGSLGGIQIRSALRAEAGILSNDCNRLLQPLLDHREDDPPALEALGLPLQWRYLEGAVIYYRILEATKKKSTLSLLAKRIAQILFYLNYRWLEKNIKGPSKSVATLILNACPEEPKDPKLMKPRRDNITGYHKRRGERWWLHAACLGSRIVAHASGIMETEIITSSRKEKLQVFTGAQLSGTLHFLTGTSKS